MQFHNPYNFVRTPARGQKVLESHFAGDYDPSRPEHKENFSRYWPERYTGEISVRLRTATPLFITEPGSKRELEEGSDHYVYDCVREIPAATLKGMLSSAYEIITNSRYRVFSEKQHSKRLGFRYQANAALVPGRISCEDGRFSVTLFTGTSRIGSDKADGPLYAAWLPAYRGGGRIIPDNIRDGMYCEGVELGLYSYDGGRFKLWSVKSICGKKLQPVSGNIGSECESTIIADGYAVISGKIINGKHDERFFFNAGGKSPIVLPISDAERERYEDLIADYQKNHAIVNGRVANPPNDPKNEGVALGRHIIDHNKLKMSEGDFVYVKTNGTRIEAMYPVQISRELSEASVWECLDDSLKPASSISELSPADRLFGWVNQSGTGSWKGKVQITSGIYEPSDDNPDPIEHFLRPLTLSILGEPKPSQARFYLGKQDGSPQNKGIPKERASYTKGKHIRGRKVYLHHTLHYLKKDEREKYWSPFADDSMTREYMLSEEATNQNRSITGWIPAKRTFVFTVRVENLTCEELGALLTLFSIDNGCFRLGYGKPLGFGSVRLSLSGDPAVATGKEIAERYKSLSCGQKYNLSGNDREKCVKSYQKAIAAAYGDGKIEELEAPDVLSFDEGIYDLLGEQKVKLQEVWLSALNDDRDTAPINELPEKEILTEFFPQEYFEGKYKEDLRKWREYRKRYKRNDFGWSKLDFIKAFLDSMRGFEEPVMYPFSTKGEEGFQWFVQNERTINGTCEGYSLPVIGKTLEEL